MFFCLPRPIANASSGTDFVMVEIRGEITAKPEGEEGWDNRIEIKEILNVSAIKSEGTSVVKLGTK